MGKEIDIGVGSCRGRGHVKRKERGTNGLRKALPVQWGIPVGVCMKQEAES